MLSLVLEATYIQSGFWLNIYIYGQESYNEWKGSQYKTTEVRDSEIVPSYCFSSLTSPTWVTLSFLELAQHLMNILGIVWMLERKLPHGRWGKDVEMEDT